MIFYTVGDYMKEARVLLQDQVLPYRYNDDDLVTALNSCLYEIARIRPDILADYRYRRPHPPHEGLDDNIPEEFTLDNMNAIVPVPAPYKMPVVYYMNGALQLRDVEDSTDQRATIFLGLVSKQSISI